MKNKNNFYIVRFYFNNECYCAINITKRDAEDFAEHFEDAHENEAGGITTWFRVDVAKRYKDLVQGVIKNADSDENIVVSPIKL
jgi:hypothetical protein